MPFYLKSRNYRVSATDKTQEAEYHNRVGRLWPLYSKLEQETVIVSTGRTLCTYVDLRHLSVRFYSLLLARTDHECPRFPLLHQQRLQTNLHAARLGAQAQLQVPRGKLEPAVCALALTLSNIQGAATRGIPSRRVSSSDRARRCLILTFWSSIAPKLTAHFGWTASSFKLKQ